MTDFKSAFKEGMNEVQRANAANAEIDSVFKDLNQQLAEVSEGRLLIERDLRERPSSPWAAWVEQAPQPEDSILKWPELYWALVASNPKIKSSPEELCEWDSDRAGYPCKLTWGGKIYYCEDKQALEKALSSLLRDPIVNEKMTSLMNIKSKKK